MTNEKTDEIKEFMARFDKEGLKALCKAGSAAELKDAAVKLGCEISDEQSELLFGVLAPLGYKEPLSDENLDSVAGGVSEFYGQRSGLRSQKPRTKTVKVL